MPYTPSSGWMLSTIREDGRYQCKAVYTVLALNLEGKKEILGLYLSENEGANFWLSVMTDLQNRGVSDILIACVDGLPGFPEAINSIYPATIRKVITQRSRLNQCIVSSES